MTVNVNIDAPENIQRLLAEIVDAFRRVVGDELVGVYLHGSLAMGCFNPDASDIDVLIVVRRPLPVDTKRRIGRALLWLSEQAPPKGLEMSVVTLDALRRYEHPTPYELHFSNSWKDAYAQGGVDFAAQRRDGDLAAHFVITRQRGRVLFGEPIEHVFPNVPTDAYINSIVADTHDSIANVMNGPDAGACAVPTYAVLNFCRVLAFIGDRLVTSKAEAGAWGFASLPAEHTPVVREALREYKKAGSSQSVDAKALKALAVYVQRRIAAAS